MTVTYSANVATSGIFCFLKLLFRWRGSIYKILWKEYLLFILAYFTLSFTYRFALNEWSRSIFERIARYCHEYSQLIPLAFVLGFYVSLVVSRWWEQFSKIPWPDRMALFVTAHIHGHDDRGRLMRRTIMRYLCLSYVITMHSISPAVKRRFPTFTHMTQAGFMLPNEEKIIDEIQTPHNKYFIPLAWATSLVTRARKEGKIKDDFAVKTLSDEINEFRGCLATLFIFDWISIPLEYTQVVTWASYTFFLSCLMGRQFIENGPVPDVYVPVFTLLQFFFYMGWLKVAECMVNPFGDDDDDFDMNSVIDRNLQVSYLIVDEMHSEHPELIKDQYWDEVEFTLPYTAETASLRASTPHMGSAMSLTASLKDREFVIPSSIAEETEHDIELANIGRNGMTSSDNNLHKNCVLTPEHNQKPRFPRGVSNDDEDITILSSTNTIRRLSDGSENDGVFRMSQSELEDEMQVSTASCKPKSWRPSFFDKMMLTRQRSKGNHSPRLFKRSESATTSTKSLQQQKRHDQSPLLETKEKHSDDQIADDQIADDHRADAHRADAHRVDDHIARQESLSDF